MPYFIIKIEGKIIVEVKMFKMIKYILENVLEIHKLLILTSLNNQLNNIKF